MEGGFIGCGTLYGAVITNGVRGDLLEMGNSKSFEITENGELKSRMSNKCSTFGDALDTTLVREPANVKFMLDDLNKDVLASLFNSTPTDVVANIAAVVDEDVVVANVVDGLVLRTSLRNVSNLVVKSTDTLTTYTEGTDYEVENLAAGLFKLLPGTAIVASTLKVSYDSAASTSDTMSGGSTGTTHLYLLLEGKNRTSDKPFSVECFDGAFQPNSSFDFLSKEYVELEMDGLLIVPATESSAYTVTFEK